MQIQQAYNYAFAPTSGTAFTRAQCPDGVASGVYVTANLATLTLTKPDGVDVVLGAMLINNLIPIRCIKATFSGGSIVALA